MHPILAWFAADRSLAAARSSPPLADWRRLAVIAALAVLLRFLVYLAIARHYGGLDAICQWDCHWYVDTIHDGYDAAPRAIGRELGRANWAFFPGYILAARGFAAIPGVSALNAAIIVSLLATVAFLTVSLRYLQLTRDRFAPGLWIAFAMAFPYGFYWSSGYTESLSLFLMTATLYAVMRERPYATAALTALTTATRAVGIALLPLVIVERAAFVVGAWRQRTGAGARLHALVDGLLPIAIAPLGLVAFMAYLHVHTGDALAFSHVQAGWGRFADPFWRNIFKGLGKWDLSELPEASRTLGALAGLTAIAAAVALALRRRPIEAWLCFAGVVIPLSTGLESMPRYVAGVPVFLFLLFDMLRAIRRAWLQWLIVLAAAALQLLLLRYWFLGAHFLT